MKVSEKRTKTVWLALDNEALQAIIAKSLAVRGHVPQHYKGELFILTMLDDLQPDVVVLNERLQNGGRRRADAAD